MIRKATTPKLEYETAGEAGTCSQPGGGYGCVIDLSQMLEGSRLVCKKSSKFPTFKQTRQKKQQIFKVSNLNRSFVFFCSKFPTLQFQIFVSPRFSLQGGDREHRHGSGANCLGPFGRWHLAGRWRRAALGERCDQVPLKKKKLGGSFRSFMVKCILW